MSCYHPLTGIPQGVNPATGKMSYKILPYREVDQSPIYGTDVIQVPCGKCIGCRLDYSRQWANRCMLELKYHKDAWFVTLTYDQAHVPMSWYSDPSTGEALQAMTLRKRDFQLFIKRLRRSGQQVRYFAAGEYGDKHLRPHYHAILFGLHLDDLEVYPDHVGDFPYYTSKFLQSVWDDGLDNQPYINRDGDSVKPTRGMVIVAEVNWNTCAYVARYVLKKQKGFDAEAYKVFNIEPPFSLMSRRPGIGRQYYDENDCYKYEYINVSTADGGRKFRPPKYFDRLQSEVEPESYDLVRSFRRAMADKTKELKLTQTDNDYLDMLKVEESNQESVLKALTRPL